MKPNFTLLLLLFTTVSFSQGKTFLDFRNESTAIYPGCEDAENREDCYREKVGGLILKEINTSNTAKPLGVEEFSVKVTIYSKASGEAPFKAESDNERIKGLAVAALEKLPVITPNTDFSGNPISSTYGFYVKFKKNNSTKQYEQVTKSTTEEMKKKPHPFPMVIEHAHFKNCPAEDEFVTTCFKDKLSSWIKKEMGKDLNSLKGTKAKIKLAIDIQGNVSVKSIEADSVKLKAALEKVFIKFPKMEPAVVNGQISVMAYDMPLSF
ncbi:hypothetical protein [Flavobacterium beibuense]|uniref:TonB family protein n=1 Tax=Flavobacterium beibuense TaxID=657326 RepID=A0A444WFD0_9FLAO|nr:hypothetical protein [Flavobacterium beibuense]RYJ44492.1 TonB family protein [Flavobacterium beibuense]